MSGELQAPYSCEGKNVSFVTVRKKLALPAEDARNRQKDRMREREKESGKTPHTVHIMAMM